MASKFLFLFLLPLLAISQADIKGRVVDATTLEAIPFVNVGIVERGMGTVSNEKGFLPFRWTPLSSAPKI